MSPYKIFQSNGQFFLLKEGEDFKIKNTDFQTCFTGNSLVLMGDGSYKRIDSVKIGEKVRTFNNEIASVISILNPIVGNRGLLSINNSEPFATSDHLFKSTNNTWLTANLELSKTAFPAFNEIARNYVVKQMEIGDEIYTTNGIIKIHSLNIINSGVFDDTKVYDLSLDIDSNHTYYVNNLAVHNCTGFYYCYGPEDFYDNWGGIGSCVYAFANIQCLDSFQGQVSTDPNFPTKLPPDTGCGFQAPEFSTCTDWWCSCTGSIKDGGGEGYYEVCNNGIGNVWYCPNGTEYIGPSSGPGGECGAGSCCTPNDLP
jgi:hypothetical protein